MFALTVRNLLTIFNNLLDRRYSFWLLARSRRSRILATIVKNEKKRKSGIPKGGPLANTSSWASC
jgi:hypothetical protein